MRALLKDVFLHLGATLDESDERVLAATLPAEGPAAQLSARLGGQRELRVVFDSADLKPGSELVAPGSHLLRVVDELLASAAVRAYVERPAEHRLTLAAVKALLAPARGARLGLEARETPSGWDLYVAYRLRYHARERTDAVEVVKVTLRPPAPLRVELAAPPEGFEAWPASPRKRVEESLLRPALDAADALVAERARDEAERIGEEAKKNLQRDAGRMHAYYSAQIAELTRGTRARREGAELRIEELEEERELRLRELAQAAEVRVEVEPLQLLTIEVPLAVARVVVRRSDAGARGRALPSDAGTEVEDETEAKAEVEGETGQVRGVEVVFDRTTGEVAIAPCPACDKPLASATVDACGAEHLVHQHCLAACPVCRRQTCAACELVACGSCASELCATCATACRACATPTCPTHRSTCAVCQAEGCARCQAACAHCGRPACADHRQAATPDAPAVFCERCAQPCPGCGTATPAAEQVRCATCGRKFCRECHPPKAGQCVLCAPA